MIEEETPDVSSNDAPGNAVKENIVFLRGLFGSCLLCSFVACLLVLPPAVILSILTILKFSHSNDIQGANTFDNSLKFFEGDKLTYFFSSSAQTDISVPKKENELSHTLEMLVSLHCIHHDEMTGTYLFQVDMKDAIVKQTGGKPLVNYRGSVGERIWFNQSNDGTILDVIVPKSQEMTDDISKQIGVISVFQAVLSPHEEDRVLVSNVNGVHYVDVSRRVSKLTGEVRYLQKYTRDDFLEFSDDAINQDEERLFHLSATSSHSFRNGVTINAVAETNAGIGGDKTRRREESDGGMHGVGRSTIRLVTHEKNVPVETPTGFLKLDKNKFVGFNSRRDGDFAPSRISSEFLTHGSLYKYGREMIHVAPGNTDIDEAREKLRILIAELYAPINDDLLQRMYIVKEIVSIFNSYRGTFSEFENSIKVDNLQDNIHHVDFYFMILCSVASEHDAARGQELLIQIGLLSQNDEIRDLAIHRAFDIRNPTSKLLDVLKEIYETHEDQDISSSSLLAYGALIPRCQTPSTHDDYLRRKMNAGLNYLETNFAENFKDDLFLLTLVYENAGLMISPRDTDQLRRHYVVSPVNETRRNVESYDVESKKSKAIYTGEKSIAYWQFEAGYHVGMNRFCSDTKDFKYVAKANVNSFAKFFGTYKRTFIDGQVHFESGRDAKLYVKIWNVNRKASNSWLLNCKGWIRHIYQSKKFETGVSMKYPIIGPLSINFDISLSVVLNLDVNYKVCKYDGYAHVKFIPAAELGLNAGPSVSMWGVGSGGLKFGGELTASIEPKAYVSAAQCRVGTIVEFVRSKLNVFINVWWDVTGFGKGKKTLYTSNFGRYTKTLIDKYWP